MPVTAQKSFFFLAEFSRILLWIGPLWDRVPQISRHFLTNIALRAACKYSSSQCIKVRNILQWQVTCGSPCHNPSMADIAWGKALLCTDIRGPRFHKFYGSTLPHRLRICWDHLRPNGRRKKRECMEACAGLGGGGGRFGIQGPGLVVADITCTDVLWARIQSYARRRRREGWAYVWQRGRVGKNRSLVSSQHCLCTIRVNLLWFPWPGLRGCLAISLASTP